MSVSISMVATSFIMTWIGIQARWNSGGRIDRLGAKAECSGYPIWIYLPYLEGCQDEKLFRIVMGAIG